MISATNLQQLKLREASKRQASEPMQQQQQQHHHHHHHKQQQQQQQQHQQQKPILGADYLDTYGIRDEINAAPRPGAGSAGGQRSQIADFYQNRSVLITGASGFIGKVLIEKLLRTCPGVRRIFVLIRPKWNKQPKERLRELLEAPLFDGVRSGGDGRSLEARVRLLEGDVTMRNLGLNQRDLLQVLQEVSVIFHSAATVKFDDPLKQSIGINLAGTKNMLDLCRRLPKLAALVHVSTAYANCQLSSIDEHIQLEAGQVEPEQLIRIAEWLDQDTLQQLKGRLLGARPNTYTYTKALAEWLLLKSARDLPVVICRPSIVVASWREPFAGWIDNVNGPTGILLGAGKGLIRSMFAEHQCVADLVPVDSTISTLVALAWFAHHYRAHKQLAIVTEDSSSVDCGLGLGGEPALLIDSLSPSSSAASFVSSGSQSVAHSDGESCDERPACNPLMAPEALKVHLVAGASDQQLDHQALAMDQGDKRDSIVEVQNCKPQLAIKQANSIYSAVQQRPQHQDDGYGSSRSSSNYAPSSLASSRSSSSSSSSSSCSSSSNSNARKHKRLLATTKQQQQLNGDKCNLNNQQTISARSSELNSDSDGLENKFKQFRHRLRNKLTNKQLPEELADVPVFHCTTGSENPITWGRIQVLVISLLTLFPTIQAYRYPRGSFTNSTLMDRFYRITLHYIPAYMVDFFTKLAGGKPILVKIFRKFDQAADVLQAFTSKQWHFAHENRVALMDELMNDEDRRLFNCDVKQLDWKQFMQSYTIGVRKFMLKEPMSNLKQARKNLSFLYYRNLGLQVLVAAIGVYLVVPSGWLMIPLVAQMGRAWG